MSFVQVKKMMMASGASAVMQIDGGEFTPAADLDSGTYTINHSLGAVPDLVVLYSPDAGSTSSYGGSATGVIYALLANASQGLLGTAFRRISSGSPAANPNISTSSNRGISATATEVVLSFDGSATVPFALPGGYTYYWIAAKFI